MLDIGVFYEKKSQEKTPIGPVDINMNTPKKRKRSCVPPEILTDCPVDKWLTVQEINLYILKRCFRKGDMPPIPIDLITMSSNASETIKLLRKTETVEVKHELLIQRHKMNDVCFIVHELVSGALGLDRQASDVATVVMGYFTGEPRDIFDLIVWPRRHGIWDWRGWYFNKYASTDTNTNRLLNKFIFE